MFKRLMSFFSYFIVLLLYLQLTGILLASDNLPALMVVEGLIIGGLVLLAIKYQVFDIRLMSKKDWLTFLIGVLVAFLQIVVFSLFSRGGSGARDSIAQLDMSRLTTALTMMIIGPVMEELLIRGVLQKGAFENSHFGILVASILFAWLHTPYTLVGFLSYFSAGAILGYMYKVSGNILPSICLHILNNSMVYLFMVL